MAPARPRLVVFDLDRTLWPFWVDTHVTPPFYVSKGKVYDAFNERVRPYPEVQAELARLHADGYTMAAASRTSEVRGANQLIKLFGWEPYFTYKEIYPGGKKAHFSRFRRQSGIEYSEMLFFDDESRNIRDVTELGVVSILVNHSGVTKEAVKRGLDEFAKQRSGMKC